MRKAAGIFLLAMVILNGYARPCPAEIKKHLVAYTQQIVGWAPTVARDFDVLDTQWEGPYHTAADQIKALNPGIVILGYLNVEGVYGYDDEWSTVTAHEDWFVHDSMGHRLLNAYYDWRLMDVGSAGWRDYYCERAQRHLTENPSVDGIFADDVVTLDNESRFNVLFAQIDNEKLFVGNDGKTLTPAFPVWMGPYSPYSKNNLVVSTAPYSVGMSSFTVLSYSTHTITLQGGLAPGSTVYASYGARNYHEAAYDGIDGYLQPPQAEVDSALADMIGFLAQAKAALGSRPLVLNTAGHEDEFLTVADGVMSEGFVHPAHFGDSDFFSVPGWKQQVDALATRSAAGKMYQAQCGTNGDSGDYLHPTPAFQAKVKKVMMYCLASYLLGASDSASFYFRDPEGTGEYESLAYYPEWDVDLGIPEGSYYLVEDSACAFGSATPSPNLVRNPSYEDGMLPWTKEVWSGSIDVSVDNAVSRTGNSSVRVSALSGSDNTGGPFQYLTTLKPNTTYMVSAWVKTDNTVGEYGVGGMLALYLGCNKSDYTIMVPDGTHDWTYASGPVVTSSDTAGAYIFGGQLHHGTGTAWFDDVKVREGVYPVYARDYEKGRVLVSPSNGSCTVKLGAPYVTLDGREVRDLDLGPYEGIILIKKEFFVSTETVSGTPPVRLAPTVLTPNGDGRNDRMLIRYSRGAGDEVRIKVYDMQGIVVCERTLSESLEERLRTDGTYGYLWDGKGFDPAGIRQGPYIMVVTKNGRVVHKQNFLIIQ